jgi:hypothetical protein
MTVDRQPANDGHTITVRAPMTFRRFGGRKLVIVREGGEAPTAAEPPELESPLIRTLACAFRCRKQLEDGTRKSLGDVARAEKISSSYVTRILQLSTLAPDIVEAILDGEIEGVGLMQRLQRNMPLGWADQRHVIAERRRRLRRSARTSGN